jgi:hypothetical protein
MEGFGGGELVWRFGTWEIGILGEGVEELCLQFSAETPPKSSVEFTKLAVSKLPTIPTSSLKASTAFSSFAISKQFCVVFLTKSSKINIWANSKNTKSDWGVWDLKWWERRLKVEGEVDQVEDWGTLKLELLGGKPKERVDKHRKKLQERLKVAKASSKAQTNSKEVLSSLS